MAGPSQEAWLPGRAAKRKASAADNLSGVVVGPSGHRLFGLAEAPLDAPAEIGQRADRRERFPKAGLSTMRLQDAKP